MTNIYEYIQTQKIDKKQITQAEQLFLDNIGHIEKIKEAKGYKMIRKYWVSEGNNALSELVKLDINNTSGLAKEKAKLELATKFIQYLDAHEKGLS